MLDKDKQRKVNNYAKYSGLAIQMIVTICLGVFGGMKLDAYFNLKFPAFMLTLSLLAVVGVMVIVIRSLK